jgi:hypothetical protein
MNLIGGILGGILEYSSMYFGFQMLYLFALGLYAAALLSSLIFHVEGSTTSSIAAARFRAGHDTGL